jgi:hypothetical protein
MDMSYYLKEKLECRDCKHPLKFSKEIAWSNSYIAICIVCNQEYEVDFEVKIHRKEKS